MQNGGGVGRACHKDWASRKKTPQPGGGGGESRTSGLEKEKKRGGETNGPFRCNEDGGGSSGQGETLKRPAKDRTFNSGGDRKEREGKLN